ncbi:MAG: calcineurin-like phosphoesterase C-terminal domain-containing protein [bacterium]|jgi:hypothetical protein
MKKVFCYVFMCMVFLVGSVASDADAATVTGIVFEDLNGNQQLDEGEKGIPDILVSNQLDIVKTDASGRYEISLPDEEAVLFVIKPPHYALPVNEDNLPQFYYIHQPEGSPQFSYKGVEPTGDLPEEIHFALLPTKLTNSFDVLVFSDPQPRSKEEIDYVRDDVISELIDTDMAFGITLGDIMFDNLSHYDYYNDIIAQIGIPFYNVPGNHDMNYDAPDDRHSLETYKSIFGPPYYAFEHGMVNFITLDSVNWFGKTEEKRGYYIGKLGDRQLEWIANYLKHIPEDHLIVFTMHIPLYFSQESGDSVNITDREKLFDLLKGRKHLLALAGHMHKFEQVNMDETIGRTDSTPFPMITCAAVCGSWWSGPKDERGIPATVQADGTPNGYHIFSFRGNRFSQTFKPANFDITHQLRITSPRGTIAQSDSSDTQIIVNVFNGNDQSLVEYQIDDRQPVRMQQTSMIDPFVIKYHEQYDELIPGFVSPAKTNHIWTAELPGDLSRGIHTITIRTIDAYGKEYQQSQIFVIE